MLEEVFKHSQEFDLIHFHFDYWHLPYLRMLKTPSLTTLHARLDYQPLSKILERYVDFPAVSISQAQRKPAPWLNWQETIYHGLPKQLFSINENPSNYILFLGRLCPEKRPDRAIEIAQRAGIPLKIAAKVDPLDRNYFSNVIEPLLNGPSVEYIGEVNDQQKQQLIGNALALIHPIEFPEPFGLVMIEAMACGTPTVAFRTGSIPEVIDHGVTGFIVDDIESAVAALKNISSLDRRHCRQVFEERFSASRMADEYIKVYEQLIKLYSPSSPLDQLSSNLESKSNFVPSKA
jgi:glycosyltransferase involved in cell wall biosynthesis